jgi:hypothetical protein
VKHEHADGTERRCLREHMNGLPEKMRDERVAGAALTGMLV